MKKISKLVLSQIAKKELTQRQQGLIKGGKGCSCGCCYKDSGGSSSDVNGGANCRGGGLHTYCPALYIYGC